MKQDTRTKVIYCLFLFLFALVSIKISYLQLFKRDFFQRLAQNQHYKLLRLEGKRGDIFDSKGRILAAGLSCYSIFADPQRVRNPDLLADVLSKTLDIHRKNLLYKLKKQNRFVWVKRKISWEEKERIKSLKLEGVGFVREERRFYPQGSLSSSVVGIVDTDNKGLEGLELFYNDYLSGKVGWVRTLQDSSSREVVLSSQVMTPQKGADLVLSLDAQIQYWAKDFLDNTIKKFKAKGGGAVVMRASTGEILALANHPSFDPNDNDSISAGNLKNGTICDMFEPGSVFKIVTLTAALGNSKFSEEDIIFCENGKLKIPGGVLHDWKPYGELSFREVFMKSSNIGVAKIAHSLGSELILRQIRRLGFGASTGIDLPGEINGKVRPLGQWSRTSLYMVPIGQEIGINFMQIIRAFAAIANGGYLVEPHLIKNICSRGFCKAASFSKKRIFPKAVASRAKDILIEVVEEGTGRRGAVEGRKIGGKTGTAQKYDIKLKRYSPTRYRATFVGFIADIDPPIVIGVTVDEPKVSHFGGVVAAPAFKNIAQMVIKYIEQDAS